MGPPSGPCQDSWVRRCVSVSLGRGGRRRGAEAAPERPSRTQSSATGGYGAAGGEQRPSDAHTGCGSGALASGGLRSLVGPWVNAARCTVAARRLHRCLTTV